MEDKIVISLFTEPGKKRHTCPICEAYKREIRKHNKEAFLFYLKHIYEIAEKSKGNSFTIRKSEVVKEFGQGKDFDQMVFALPEHSDEKAKKGRHKEPSA
jgi:hypothetical protein